MNQQDTSQQHGFDYQNYTLLVVDDYPLNLSLIVDYLSEFGFQIIIAQTGEEAIELAKSEKPDLVLLDVMLPGINGFETCKRLKSNAETSDIIVIFMTVLTDTEDKVKGFNLGAVDYVTKPFQQGELLARVTTHLRLKALTENLEQEVNKQTQALTVANEKLQRKIEESKKIEEALRESESRYRAAMENANDGIAIIEGGRFTFFNRQLLTILGYAHPDELIGKTVDIIFHPDEKERILKYNELREAGKKAPERYEAKGITKNHRLLYFDVSATRITYKDHYAVLAFFTDITKRKLLEAQLQQAQKMEAIGTLAGGIAHDFNNILCIISGYAEMVQQDEHLTVETQDYISEMLVASDRASQLVQQILTFSRQKEVERKPLILSQLVKETLKMLRASLPSTIEIRSNIKDYKSLVMADSTQIHQVLVNLCTNAAHAMQNQVGILEIVLTKELIDGNHSSQLKAGPHLKLTITDNGHGIDQNTLERIFDPYFTTKSQGEGTGLGLSVVHGIVTSYGGTVQVESKPDKGTSFHIHLPVIGEQKKVSGPKLQLKNLPRGRERILFIDDETLVLSLYGDMLKKLDYAVTATTSSTEAWELFSENPTAFDLVLTDLTMPHLTGDMLTQKMLHLRPDIPIIIYTGYSSRFSHEQAIALGAKKYLLKPLVFEQLALALREVLDG